MSLKVGIQLYSVREEMEKNPIEAIRALGNMGYRYLEVANHNAEADNGVGFGATAEEVRAALDDIGSQIVSAHIFPFHEKTFSSVIDYNQKIGNTNIIEPMGFFSDLEDLKRKAEFYNKCGAVCRREGMHFLYHNHFQEFSMAEGKPLLYWLAEYTDPELMSFELDTFWTMRGGFDPVTVIQTLGSRIRLLHQKDFAKDSPRKVNIFEAVGGDQNMVTGLDAFHHYMEVNAFGPEDFTEIGTGIMDIQRIINAANEIGAAEYIILEQDYTQHAQMESVRISMDAFRKFTGISWE